jgi:hypothetical protein
VHTAAILLNPDIASRAQRTVLRIDLQPNRDFSLFLDLLIYVACQSGVASNVACGAQGSPTFGACKRLTMSTCRLSVDHPAVGSDAVTVVGSMRCHECTDGSFIDSFDLSTKEIFEILNRHAVTAVFLGTYYWNVIVSQ